MTIARGRRIEHEGRTYEWVVRRRGNTFRLVAQDAADRGQILIARFPVYVLCLLNEAHGEFFVRTRIDPARLRSQIADALRGGWRPAEKGLSPFRSGSADGWAPEELDHVDDFWTVLDAICRDPVWRARLADNACEYVPVPPEYVRGLDPGLADRLAGAGELVVYARTFDHGDTEPWLAIANPAWGRDVVLENISDWHRGFHGPRT